MNNFCTIFLIWIFHVQISVWAQLSDLPACAVGCPSSVCPNAPNSMSCICTRPGEGEMNNCIVASCFDPLQPDTQTTVENAERIWFSFCGKAPIYDIDIRPILG